MQRVRLNKSILVKKASARTAASDCSRSRTSSSADSPAPCSRTSCTAASREKSDRHAERPSGNSTDTDERNLHSLSIRAGSNVCDAGHFARAGLFDSNGKHRQRRPTFAASRTSALACFSMGMSGSVPSRLGFLQENNVGIIVAGRIVRLFPFGDSWRERADRLPLLP